MSRCFYWKYFLSLLLILSISQNHLFGQSSLNFKSKYNIGVGVEVNSLLGDFGQDFKVGVEPKLAFLYKYDADLYFSFTVSYINFHGKNYEDQFFIVAKPDWKIIPLQLGAFYYPIKWLFINGSMGIAISPRSNDSFILSPGIGVHLFSSFRLGVRLKSINNNVGSVTAFSGSLIFNF